MIFEMGEKLKEVRVTSEYSHVGLPTQVTPVSRLVLVCLLVMADSILAVIATVIWEFISCRCTMN